MISTDGAWFYPYVLRDNNLMPLSAKGSDG